MEMKPEMKKHFYVSSQLMGAVTATDFICLEECYFNETCQLFTFKDSICFLGVNFANILQADYCRKVLCAAFLYLQFGFVIFCQKAACVTTRSSLKLPLVRILSCLHAFKISCFVYDSVK